MHIFRLLVPAAIMIALFGGSGATQVAAAEKASCTGVIAIAEGGGCDPEDHPVRSMRGGVETIEACTPFGFLKVWANPANNGLHFNARYAPEVCGDSPEVPAFQGSAPSGAIGNGEPVDQPVDISLSHQPSVKACTVYDDAMVVIYLDMDTSTLSYFTVDSSECHWTKNPRGA